MNYVVHAVQRVLRIDPLKAFNALLVGVFKIPFFVAEQFLGDPNFLTYRHVANSSRYLVAAVVPKSFAARVFSHRFPLFCCAGFIRESRTNLKRVLVYPSIVYPSI